METSVTEHIVKHMEEQNLFTDKQYGFMSGRSTALQLLKVMDTWTEALDKNLAIDCIYMDYQKAFDTVPHQRLLGKLQTYGITGNIHQWITDFLLGRQQQVLVNGESSDWRDVTSGIPQGSVLGPTLFLLYINDLPDSVTSEVYLFADDTKIFNIITDNESVDTLQSDLKKLEEWSNKWLLKFHPEKCKHMHIGKSSDVVVNYQLNDTTIDQVSEEKDIGVIIDNDLSFDTHISKKCSKATSVFAMLRRSFSFMDVDIFTPVYKSMVRTHLEYASSVWAPYKMKHIEQIEAVQRRVTKQLPGMKNLTYPERLKKLRLPTLSYRRKRGDMIELYKLTSGRYRMDTTNMVKYWKDATERTSERGNTLKIYPERSNSSIRRNAFIQRSIPTWNSLPEAVVRAESLNTFKNRLDKFWENQALKYDFKAQIVI